MIKVLTQKITMLVSKLLNKNLLETRLITENYQRCARHRRGPPEPVERGSCLPSPLRGVASTDFTGAHRRQMQITASLGSLQDLNQVSTQLHLVSLQDLKSRASVISKYESFKNFNQGLHLKTAQLSQSLESNFGCLFP